MSSHRRVLAVAATLAFALSCGCWSADWPQWRGPTRDCVAPSSPPLAQSWPKSGPKKVWETRLPTGGWGSPVIANGACFLYIHANQDKKDIIVCLDALTGTPRWKKELPGVSTLQDASSTPTVVDGKVFVAAAKTAYCLNAADGSVVWKADYRPGQQWATETMEFSSSFLVVGDTAIVCAGQVNAFDVRTGQIRWTGPDLWGNAAGIASAARWSDKGREYAVCSGIGLACYDLAAGKEIWRVGGKGTVQYGSSPTVSGADAVAIVDGQLCRVRMTPSKGEIVWHIPFLDDFSSAAIRGKHVYTVGKNSKTGPVVATCRDLATSKVLWETPVAPNEYSSPIIADGKLLALVDKGATLVQIDANPKARGKILASAKVGALVWTTPTFSDGRVYLRLKDGIACYDLTKKGNR
jgi:outer membrane protein assembly factor BamB